MQIQTSCLHPHVVLFLFLLKAPFRSFQIQLYLKDYPIYEGINSHMASVYVYGTLYI